jgi:outer membrane protein OmpA-like peptidoglycan-associated protein
MTIRAVLLAAIAALPVGAHAQPTAQADHELATQLATTLASSSDADSKPARAPRLDKVTAPSADVPNGRASDAPKLGEGRHVAAAPTIDSKLPKIEAQGSRSSAYQAGRGGATRAASVGHPHRVKLVSCDPGQLNKVDEVVRAWNSDRKWDAITVDGYADARGRSAADTLKLAQRTAETIRAYLVRHGVPAEVVIATGHAADPVGAHATKIDITVTTCDGLAIACRARPAR